MYEKHIQSGKACGRFDYCDRHSIASIRTSFEDVCEGSLGSNIVSNFTEAVTGKDVSNAGQWYSVTGGAVCDAVGSVEGVAVKVAHRTLTIMGG